jgi:peroxiredoxin
MRRFVLGLLGVLTLLAAGSLAPAAETLAPPWELNDLEGQPHRLEEWRGKWVLLKLGTTKCPNCALELEELGKVHGRLDTLGVEVLDIYLREDRYTVKKYWKKKGEGTYRPLVLYDHRGDLIRDYGVSVIPQLVLVSPSGAMVWKAWYTPGEELLKIISSHVPPGSSGGQVD